MIFYKKLLIFSSINICILNFGLVNAENAIDLQYILRPQSDVWTYHLYLKNQSNSPLDMKTYVNWIVNPNISTRLLTDNLQVSNFLNVSWVFSVEKFISSFTDWNVSVASDSKSKNIVVRSLDDTYFFWDYSIDYFWPKLVYSLPINSNIDALNFSNKIYQLDIDWQLYPLEFDKWVYEDWKYYIWKKQIRFAWKNILNALSKITLVIDSLKSNYVILNKKIYNIQDLWVLEITQWLSWRDLRIHIRNDAKLKNTDNLDFYINNQKIDINDVTIFSWEIIIRVDISKKVDDILEIYFKDNSLNTFSNKLILNLTKYTTPTITKLDFWQTYWVSNSFIFKILGNDNSLFWNLFDYKLNLNWTWYTIIWEKDYLKNPDWTVSKDFWGNDRYYIIKNIWLQRNGTSELYFPFFYDQLEDTNKLSIHNWTFEKTSNVVYFTKDLLTIDYDFWKVETKDESLSYPEPDRIEKNIDFLQKPENSFNLWKIAFNDFKSNSYYKVRFIVKSDSKINPFSDLKFWNDNLELVKSNDWIVYSYEKTWYGNSFTEQSLTFALNDLFNTNKTLNLKVTDLKIFWLNQDSKFIDIYDDNTDKNISVDYKYNISSCFDWASDYCNAMNLWWDSKLDLILSFWNDVKKQEAKGIVSNQNNINDDNFIPSVADKNSFAKQFILSRNKLNKSAKNKKYISKIDKIVTNLSANQSKIILSRIAKIDKKKLWNVADVILYLEASIWNNVYK